MLCKVLQWFVYFSALYFFQTICSSSRKIYAIDIIDLTDEHFPNYSYISQYVKFLLLLICFDDCTPVKASHLPFPVIDWICTVSLQGSWHLASSWATFSFRLLIFWLFESYISCKNLQGKKEVFLSEKRFCISLENGYLIIISRILPNKLLHSWKNYKIRLLCWVELKSYAFFGKEKWDRREIYFGLSMGTYGVY